MNVFELLRITKLIEQVKSNTVLSIRLVKPMVPVMESVGFRIHAILEDIETTPSGTFIMTVKQWFPIPDDPNKTFRINVDPEDPCIIAISMTTGPRGGSIASEGRIKTVLFSRKWQELVDNGTLLASGEEIERACNGKDT